MQVVDKIKKIRELNGYTQEYMAEKLDVSVLSYSKIENGKVRLHLSILEKIAEILNISLLDLLSLDDNSVICIVSENNSQNSGNIYGFYDKNSVIIDKLQIKLDAKEEKIHDLEKIILQQSEQIQILKEMIESLKQKS